MGAAGDERAGLLANTAWRALADVGSKVASVALFVVMARELGDAGFGVFTFALGYVLIFTSLARFGQDAVLTRAVAREPSSLSIYFGDTLALKLALALPAGALGVGVLALTGTDATTLTVVAILMPAVLVETLVNTPIAVFQAFEQLRLVPRVLITQRFATAAVGIAVLLAGGDVVAVALVYLGGALLALALGLVVQFRRVARPPFRVDRSRWGPLMRAAVPLGIAGTLAVVMFRVDAVILAAFEPDEVVGDYGAAYRLFEATLFLSWAVGAAAFPVFSRLEETGELQATLERSLALGLALTAPLAAGAAVAGGAAVEVVFGEDYAEGADALRLLAPAILLFPVGYVTGLFLVARHRQRAVAWTYGVLAVANIGLNLALIPRFSLNASAFVTSLSETGVAVALLAVSARLLGGLGWARIGLAPLTAGGIAALAMLPFRDDLVAAALAGSVAYLAALAVVERLAFPEDARAVWRAVRAR
ncbi:MAG TPA: flippase [Gaiellaceae bacterium]|nr:flippase [Gaiellaceae bacterium]